MPQGRFAEDLVGRVFGQLTVLARLKSTPGQAFWICHCECGNFSAPLSHSLRKRLTASCGCIRAKVIGKNKLCAACGQWKAHGEFYPERSGGSVLAPYCKPCIKLKKSEAYRRDPAATRD